MFTKFYKTLLLLIFLIISISCTTENKVLPNPNDQSGPEIDLVLINPRINMAEAYGMEDNSNYSECNPDLTARFTNIQENSVFTFVATANDAGSGVRLIKIEVTFQYKCGAAASFDKNFMREQYFTDYSPDPEYHVVRKVALSFDFSELLHNCLDLSPRFDPEGAIINIFAFDGSNNATSVNYNFEFGSVRWN